MSWNAVRSRFSGLGRESATLLPCPGVVDNEVKTELFDARRQSEPLKEEEATQQRALASVQGDRMSLVMARALLSRLSFQNSKLEKRTKRAERLASSSKKHGAASGGGEWSSSQDLCCSRGKGEGKRQ